MLGATLSLEDLHRLGDASRVLLSPIGGGDQPDWPSQVIQTVKPLLGADKATLILSPQDPVTKKNALLYSDGVDLAELRRYGGYYASLEKQYPYLQRELRLGVWTRRTLWADRAPSMYKSEYYNEYIVPLRAYDTLAITVSLGIGRGTANLLVHHDRQNGRRFGGHGAALFAAILPALKAGASAYMAAIGAHEERTLVFDSLGDGVAIFSRAGVQLHQNRAMSAFFHNDPDLRRCSAEIHALAEEVANTALSRMDTRATFARSLRTANATYSLRGILVPPYMVDRDHAVAVILQETTRKPPSDEVLVRLFGLTPVEARVASLLSRRATNDEVASALGVSIHTARHHTESVLRKLGVHSRSQVKYRLSAMTDEPDTQCD